MSKHLVRDNVESGRCCQCPCKAILTEKILVAGGGCSSDAAAVATLPNDWTPRRSGPILSNYLKQLEHNHKEAIEDLNSKTCTINRDVDSKVRELAEILVDHIDHNQREIDQAVLSSNAFDKPLQPFKRTEILQEINELYNRRLQDVATFKQNALDLENERVQRLKSTIRDQFQNVVKIGFHPPQTLTQDFNNRMYDINQQLFDNIRAYDELEEELKADADDNVVRARSALNQLSISVDQSVLYRAGSARRPSERRYSSKRSLSAGERKANYQPILNKIINNSQEIENCVSQLVEAYRTTIIKVFDGFQDSLKDLLHHLTSDKVCINTYKMGSTSALEQKIDKAFEHICSTVQEQQSTTSVNLLQVPEVSNMQRSLTSLKTSLKDMYAVLNSAGHLWDAHILRSALSQKLTITAVEDLITNNDATEQANEVAYNLALEQMAVASDEDKLNFQFADAMRLLDATAELYQVHSKAEVARLEQYLNLPPIMADILLAEFRFFLHKNKKTAVTSATSIGPGISSISQISSNDPAALARIILQTELQENNLNNWRNGFLEALENSVYQIPGDLKNHAQYWVDEKAVVLRYRYSMKCVAHGVRAERLKALYERRLAELRYHASRLKSHVVAVEAILKELSDEVPEYLSLDSPELYPIGEWIKRINDDMQLVLNNPDVDPEVCRLKMSSYAPRLTIYRQRFEESLDRVFPDYKQKLENRVQMLRISNMQYMADVALFHEGGKYSVAEALKLVAALQRVSETVEHCNSRLMEAVVARHAQLLAMADTELLPLRRVVEGFVKIKGGAAKIEKKDSKKKK